MTIGWERNQLYGKFRRAVTSRTVSEVNGQDVITNLKFATFTSIAWGMLIEVSAAIPRTATFTADVEIHTVVLYRCREDSVTAEIRLRGTGLYLPSICRHIISIKFSCSG